MQPDLSSFLGEGADTGAWEEGGLMIGVKERESKRGNEISRFWGVGGLIPLNFRVC